MRGMARIVVRPAIPEEVKELATLGLASWDFGIGPLVPPAVRAEWLATNPFLPFLQEQGSDVLVAQVEGVPIGIGAWEKDVGHITDLWIAPAHEGRGAGSALLAALEATIAGAGFQEATLEVLTFNDRALRLYLYRGYRPLWQGKKLDRLTKIVLDKTCMAKALLG
jgi:ribosomal-protein-alanine N-acetyltransferase